MLMYPSRDSLTLSNLPSQDPMLHALPSPCHLNQYPHNYLVTVLSFWANCSHKYISNPHLRSGFGLSSTKNHTQIKSFHIGPVVPS